MGSRGDSGVVVHREQTQKRLGVLASLPTLSMLGLAEPVAMPAAFFRSTDAGGDLRMKVKDLSV